MAGGLARPRSSQREDARPRTQPGPATGKRIEEVFPPDVVAAAPVGNRQDKIPRRIDNRHDERVLRAWNRRHDVATGHGLKLRHDPGRTWRAAVVRSRPSCTSQPARHPSARSTARLAPAVRQW